MPRIMIKDVPNDLKLIGRNKMKRIAKGIEPRQTKAKMGIQEATRIAEAFVRLIQSQCHRVEIVGSVRRGKTNVNDIDVVAIPKNPRGFLYGIQVQVRNPAIPSIEFLGAKVDLFIATPETYGIMKLIRTGSAPFNVRLCLAAEKKGWELDYARGLITDRGVIRSEEKILRAVLGRVPEPRERD